MNSAAVEVAVAAAVSAVKAEVRQAVVQIVHDFGPASVQEQRNLERLLALTVLQDLEGGR